MNIVLYENQSEKNKIGKTLINELSLNGTLRDATNVINPVVLIEAQTLGTKNYCYIVDFSRFYFITEIMAVRTGLWAVNLSVDVLESFKNDIKDLNVILSNTQSNGLNYYLPSNVYMNNVKTYTDIFNFSNGLLDSGEFILITAGG